LKKIEQEEQMGEGHELLQDEEVPVIVADDVGIIVRVNKKFEETFGWQAS